MKAGGEQFAAGFSHLLFCVAGAPCVESLDPVGMIYVFARLLFIEKGAAVFRGVRLSFT